MRLESSVEGVDPDLAGGWLETVVGGRGSRWVPVDERDGGRGQVTVDKRDGGGDCVTVDERDGGSCLVSKGQMSGVAEGVKGDISRPLVKRGTPWETTGSGRRRVAVDGVGNRAC